MKHLYIFFTTLLVALSASAQKRTAAEMASIAGNFFSNAHSAKTATLGSSDYTNSNGYSMRLQTMSSQVITNVTSDNEAFAVYAPDNTTGFIIVSADSEMPEVLAYSDNETFDTSNGDNNALTDLLESYVQAAKLITSGQSTAEEIFGSSKNILTEGTATKVDALLGNVAFNQLAPYNLQCPMLNGSHTATGCGPTAMAQLMMHYKKATIKGGTVNYYTATNKLPVNWDFSKTAIEWTKISDTYSTGVYEAPKAVTTSTDAAPWQLEGLKLFENSPQALSLQELCNYSTAYQEAYIACLIGKDKNNLYEAGLPAKVICKGYVSEDEKYGWDSYNIYPSVPDGLTDGDYKMFFGVTTDRNAEKPTYKLISLRSQQQDQGAASISVTKSGNNVTFQATTEVSRSFPCAVTSEEAKPISTLMAAIGAATKSDYGTSTSTHQDTLYFAMHDYFGYDRDIYSFDSNTAPIDTIIKEASKAINGGQVLSVIGAPKDSTAHFFLLDGYDASSANTRFHINWGWGGTSNGMYLLTNMQPSEAGTGGSKEDYSYSFNIAFNIIPDDSKDGPYYISSKSITLSPTEVSPEQKLSVTADYFTNNNAIRLLPDNAFLYIVNNDNGKRYKTDCYIAATQLGQLCHYDARQWEVTLPTGISNGKYHIEFHVNDSDHFVCKSNTSFTVTGATAVSAVDSHSASSANGATFDISGRQVNSNASGMVISNGKKVLK